MVVEGLLYTRQHEWAGIDGDRAVVGITEYAQDQLGELTFVELPDVGKEVRQKAELAVVESSKAASDVYSPVTGRVVEVNSALTEKPELINQDCYNTGWICKIKIADAESVKNLMDSHQYEEYLKGL